MTYTQIKIKVDYRDKLAKLAASQNRSMANMVEVLIDQAISQLVTPTNVFNGDRE